MLLHIIGGESVVANAHGCVRIYESSEDDAVHFILGPHAGLEAAVLRGKSGLDIYDPKGWFVRMVLAGVRDWYRGRRKRIPRGSAPLVMSAGKRRSRPGR